MLKHASISRTNKAQQTLQLQRQWQQQQQNKQQCDNLDDIHSLNSNCDQSEGDLWLSSGSQDADYEPQTPSLESSTIDSINSSFPVGSSQPDHNRTAYKLSRHQSLSNRASSRDSVLRVFAQSLSQDVEYITLNVDSQTNSKQIIKSLLRKFRLKHRDPNLFYLTLERWMRKDGLKFKSVMLLGDEACPLQLQQCCSNPPHNDIKFTIHSRTGALVRIYCSDVVADARYKCLSLSTQTTVDETIELMLHCLNLTLLQSSNKDQTNANDLERSTESPTSIRSNSSNSSNSSGVGSVESTPIMLRNFNKPSVDTDLDSQSQTLSVASNSSSDCSNSSMMNSELYYLVIECQDTSRQRVLESNECLVDVYQKLLLADSSNQKQRQNSYSCERKSVSPDQPTTIITTTQHPNQWFLIKLKKRVNFLPISSEQPTFGIKAAKKPKPSVPMSLAKFDHTNEIVSTTQIEINAQIRLENSKLERYTSTTCAILNESNDNQQPNNIVTSQSSNSNPINLLHDDVALATNNVDMSNIDESNNNNNILTHPNPNEINPLLKPPPVAPRRCRLASQNPLHSSTNSLSKLGTSQLSRRRYNPVQLAEDLSKLDVSLDESPSP